MPASSSVSALMPTTMNSLTSKQFTSLLKCSTHSLGMFVSLIWSLTFIRYRTPRPFRGDCEGWMVRWMLMKRIDQVYAILDEVFLAGEIEETSKQVVLTRLEHLDKLEWIMLPGFTSKFISILQTRIIEHCRSFSFNSKLWTPPTSPKNHRRIENSFKNILTPSSAFVHLK